ncbi:MAG: hypothetical protein IT233_11795 [Bacteroidia bacterium]|nr:hypothetical protein [Bacteroidia bacterium]
MNRFFPLFAFPVIAMLTACGPTEEEVAARNKKMQDSLDSIGKIDEQRMIEEMMAQQDSLDKLIADSLEKWRADSTRIQDSLQRKRTKKTIPKDGPKK